MRVGLARKYNYSSHIKEKTVGLKKGSKKKVNLKTAETGRCLKQLTGNEVLFTRRKQLKTLSVLFTWNGTTLVLDTQFLNKT